VKTLILLHGWGADGSSWRKQADAFQPPLQVMAPAIRRWDPAWLADYLQKFELGACLLAGWSLGGMLLLEVLGRERLRPGGVALVGVAPVFCARGDHPWGQPPAAVRAMRRALQDDPRGVLDDFARSCLGPAEETFREEVISLFPGGSSPDLAAGLDYLLNRDLRALLPNLTVPSVIIQGDRDRITPPAQARFLQEHLPGSRLHLFPGAGHLPFWTQAGKFNAILEEMAGGGQR
jgi:pimeloyl-[acyl-carrier protein] methyl ester esterase